MRFTQPRADDDALLFTDEKKRRRCLRVVRAIVEQV
jgi:hypothetical protein